MRHHAPAAERIFVGSVVTEGGCWTWTRARSRQGYGVLNVGSRCVQAHRFSYEALVGPIPAGLEIDHLCRNRACVNPRHLEPVTRSENVRRGWKHRVLGTGLFGERNPQARLTNEEAKQLRDDYRRGEATQAELSIAYGISQASVSRIVNERSYA